jgi:hypothetical protein
MRHLRTLEAPGGLDMDSRVDVIMRRSRGGEIKGGMRVALAPAAVVVSSSY